MKALVTGATGFAGQYLVKYLIQKGYEVTGTFFSSGGQFSLINGVAFRYLNLNDGIEKIYSMLLEEKPDEIYHLAAIAATNEADYKSYYLVNFYGTLNLYEAVKRSGLDVKILYVGSANVYGNVPEERQPITEAEELRPLNHYAVSKASADLLSYRYFCEGLNIIRARPFNHTGPGQTDKFVCSKIAKQIISIKNGLADHLEIGNTVTKRDFTDVRDVVRAYWMLLQEGRPGEAYNICSRQAYSVKNIIDMLSGVVGVEVEIKQDKQLVRHVDIPLLIGDYHKVNQETGWLPRIPLEETMKSLVNENY